LPSHSPSLYDEAGNLVRQIDANETEKARVSSTYVPLATVFEYDKIGLSHRGQVSKLKIGIAFSSDYRHSPPMARPLRVHRADAWYHVTARGTKRRDIFREEPDRRHWLELIPELAERFRVPIFAYVMMANHYHLLLSAPELNLSKAMQWFQTSYSMWFNRKHGRVGPLFQGRFHAVVVEPNAFAYELSRYVHLNPVRVKGLGLDKRTRRGARLGLTPAASEEVVRERLKVLRDFRWSSYPAYVRRQEPPKWLDRKLILERSCRGSLADQEQAYRKFVEQAIRDGHEDRFWENLLGQVALGSKDWLKRLQKRLSGQNREQPQTRSVQARPAMTQVIAAVEGVRELSWKQFRRLRGDWGRDIVWYLGWHRCGLPLRKLGDIAGGADYAAVSAAIKSIDRKLMRDNEMRRRLAAAEKALQF
jgi:putative transposase